MQNILLTKKIEKLPTDEKPSSVFVKVVDFGIFGANNGFYKEKSNAGSLKYMAPEIF